MTAGKVIRALAGVFVLLVLAFVVNGWWSDFRRATPKASPTVSTATVDATQTAPPAEPAKTVLVLTDGLNFREQPDATGASIRGLRKGENLILVSVNGSWLGVKDESGRTGWVTNNPQYVRIESK